MAGYSRGVSGKERALATDRLLIGWLGCPHEGEAGIGTGRAGRAGGGPIPADTARTRPGRRRAHNHDAGRCSRPAERQGDTETRDNAVVGRLKCSAPAAARSSSNHS